MSYGGGGETMNELTQDDCKLITEKLLGECWVESGYRVSHCSSCECGRYNRTFQDPQDFMDCFEKLVERGEWGKFTGFCNYTFMMASKDYVDEGDYEKWLLGRTESGHFRVCCLVVEWLKEEK
jgi:hypothetical protein